MHLRDKEREKHNKIVKPKQKRNEDLDQHKLLEETRSAGVTPLSSQNSAVSQADALCTSPKIKQCHQVLHTQHKQS